MKEVNQKISKKLLILHEYGAPSHYRGLRVMALANDYQIVFAEFRFFRPLCKSILRKDWSLFVHTIKNLVIVLPLLLGKRWDGPIVLGMAPFNSFIALLQRMTRNNAVFLHSSWPYWDLSKEPHQPLCKHTLLLWRKFLQGHVKRAFLVTELSRKNIQQSSFRPAATSVVFHSFDDAIFNLSPVRHEGSDLVIGFAGRLEPSKGIVDILKLAEEEYRRPIRFLIAGQGSMQSEVIRTAQKNPKLQYVGQLRKEKEVADFYRQLDILLLPSRKTEGWEELFGMVIIESMACGVFPIVTNHPGPEEIITRASFGMCCDESTFLEDAKKTIVEFPSDPIAKKSIRTAAHNASRIYSTDSVAELWAPLFLDYSEKSEGRSYSTSLSGF